MTATGKTRLDFLPLWCGRLQHWSLNGRLNAAAQGALLLDGEPQALKGLISKVSLGAFQTVSEIVEGEYFADPLKGDLSTDAQKSAIGEENNEDTINIAEQALSVEYAHPSIDNGYSSLAKMTAEGSAVILCFSAIVTGSTPESYNLSRRLGLRAMMG